MTPSGGHAPRRAVEEVHPAVVTLVNLLRGTLTDLPQRLACGHDVGHAGVRGTRLTGATPVRAGPRVGEPVYVGVFGTPADFDRTLHLAGVRVFASSTADVTI